MLFSSSVNSYALANDDWEQIPYSQVVPGDVITFTDENGLIIEVKPNDATTYSMAGTLTLSALGTGAMGVGTGTILSAALPIVAVIVGLGITVYSVPALCEKVMEIYYSLPDNAISDLTAIMSAGASSFVLTGLLKEVLAERISDVFYTDDGTFSDIGITFNPANMLEYDWSAQRVYGDKLTSSIYNTALSSNLATAIAGTTLTAQIVNSPFESDIDKALKIVNTATGASLIYQVYGDILTNTCADTVFKISSPTVVTESNADGILKHTVGFWILQECATRLAGGVCDTHTFNYHSAFYGEQSSLVNLNRFLFQNTGNALLDGIAFEGQHYYGFKNWELTYANPMDGNTSICLDLSGLSTLLGQTYDIVYNPSSALTLDDTMYLPTDDVIADVDRLTVDGVKTGTFEDVVANPSNPSIPDVDSDASFWAKLWAWLQALLDAILNIPNAIIEAIKGLADWLKTAILDALKLAFIPSEGFFTGFFADLQTTFQDRFGLLTYPISVIFTFFDSLLSVGNEEPVLSWSGWSYDGVELIKSGSFNLADILENETFKTVHDIYLIVVDAGIVFAFLSYINKKYRSVISN